MSPDPKTEEKKPDPKTEEVAAKPKEVAVGDNVRVHRIANGFTLMSGVGEVTKVTRAKRAGGEKPELSLTVKLADNGHLIEDVREPQGEITTQSNRVWPCFTPAD